MSKQETNIPKLRFLQFANSAEWEVKTLGDVLDYERPDNYIVTDTNYHDDGTPVLTANKSFILGYTEEEFGIYNNLPAIIFDDFTVDSKFVDFPFKVKSSAIKILTPKKQDDLKFIYELISQIKFNAKEHKRYYISEYQKLKLPFPSKSEQQKIASCLSSLDELIETHSQKLELLKAHKKGLMQNLFPAQGAKTPKVRFKEYKGEWVEKMLGEVCKMQAGKFIAASEIKEANNKDLFPVYGGNGLRGYTTSFNQTGMFSLIGRQGALCGNVTLAQGKFYATEHAVVVTPQKNADALWLFYMLGYLNLNQYAKGQAQPGLSVENLEKVVIKFSEDKSEQQKIASCLSSLDTLITAQAEKIEQLKLHKKGVMQNLFPKTINYATDIC